MLRKLLTQTSLPVHGFITQLDRTSPDYSLYIYPAQLPDKERRKDLENRLGSNPGKQNLDEFAAKFEELALPLISDLPDGGVIVMDELGVLESRAKGFTEKVLDILSEDRPIIIVIKDRQGVPFLDKLRSLSDFKHIRVTRENRDRLFEELAPVVRNWK